MFRVGIDVGGTFTDTYGIEEGRIYANKTATTPDNLVEGVMNSFKLAGVDIEKVDEVIHGTTAAINTLLQRSYYGWFPKIAMVTTPGMSGILKVGSYQKQYLFDLFQTKPEPFIKQRYIYEVEERTDSRGNILCKLNEEDALRLAVELKKERFDAVAICFLNSYINPTNELKCKEIFVKESVSKYIDTSAEVCPKFREQDRFSTAVIRSVLIPVMERYLGSLEDALKSRGFRGKLFIVTSDGGMKPVDDAKKAPEQIVWSGPATGAVGAALIAESTNRKNALELDMGGTTWLVSLVEDYKPLETSEASIDWDVPLMVPTIDVRSIGAGGGSIIWADELGILKIGPRSAGAKPGPACYGYGGTEPTVTDANLILNRVAPTLKGKIELKKDLAFKAMSKVSKVMGLDEVETSDGALRVLVENQTAATKLMTVDKGRDPKDYVPVVCGGAGPMHACFVADSLGIKEVIIVGNAGVTSAMGALVLPIKYYRWRTFLAKTGDVDLDALNKAYEEMESQVIREMESVGILEKDVQISHIAEMRYVGQSYEVTVPIDRGKLTKETLEKIKVRFHEEHKREYFVNMPWADSMFVYLGVTGSKFVEKFELPRFPKGGKVASAALDRVEDVYFGGKFVKTNIYNWDKLMPQNEAEGPVIVEMPNATSVVTEGWNCVVDEYKNLLLRRM